MGVVNFGNWDVFLEIIFGKCLEKFWCWLSKCGIDLGIWVGFKQQLLGGLTTQSLVNSCSIPALSQSHLPLQRLQKQGQACGAAAVQQHRFQDFAPGIKRNMGRSPAQKNNMCIYIYICIYIVKHVMPTAFKAACSHPKSFSLIRCKHRWCGHSAIIQGFGEAFPFPGLHRSRLMVHAACVLSFQPLIRFMKSLNISVNK